jgi:hypothetical protein
MIRIETKSFPIILGLTKPESLVERDNGRPTRDLIVASIFPGIVQQDIDRLAKNSGEMPLVNRLLVRTDLHDFEFVLSYVNNVHFH